MHYKSINSSKYENPIQFIICLFTGGSIGHVSVSWRVADSRTTAAKHADYRADGATLTFEEGETQQSIFCYI